MDVQEILPQLATNTGTFPREAVAQAIPTATLLEHTVLTQGFMGISKAAFPRRLLPQNRDSTWANLVSTRK